MSKKNYNLNLCKFPRKNISNGIRERGHLVIVLVSALPDNLLEPVNAGGRPAGNWGDLRPGEYIAGTQEHWLSCKCMILLVLLNGEPGSV